MSAGALLYPDDLILLPQAAKLCGVDFKTMEGWIDGVGLASRLRAERSPVTQHFQMHATDLFSFLKKNNKPIPEALGLMEKKRILVVDDEANMLSAIRRVFLDSPESVYAFETAGDGFEAGQKIERFRPHLVILDIWMPKMDGFKLCSWIKQNPKTRNTKILAISGLVKKEDQRIAVDFGADDFLEKPFENEILKEHALRLLPA